MMKTAIRKVWNSKILASFLFVLLFSSCQTAVQQPLAPLPVTQTQTVALPPPSPELHLLDFISLEASGALVIEMERLRGTDQGAELLNLFSMFFGLQDLDQFLNIPAVSESTRALVFGQVDVGRRPADLHQTLRLGHMREMFTVFELSAENLGSDGECRLDELASAESIRVEGVNERIFSRRCGRFVMLSSDTTIPEYGTGDGENPAENHLRSLIETRERQTEVLSAVFGPEIVDHASCGRRNVALRGWHTLEVTFDGSMSLDVLFHAATPDDSVGLRECLLHTVRSLSSSMIVQAFGFSSIFQNIEITHDEAETKDIRFYLPMSSEETERVLEAIRMIVHDGY